MALVAFIRIYTVRRFARAPSIVFTALAVFAPKKFNRFMAFLALILFSGATPLASATGLVAIKVTSLRQEFRAFVEVAGKTDDVLDLLDIWEENVEAPYSQFFQSVASNNSIPFPLEDGSRPNTLLVLLQEAEEIDAVFQEFEETAEFTKDTVAKMFPEAKNIEIVGLPKLYEGTANVSIIDGRMYVLIGIDTIAMLRKNPQYFPNTYLIPSMAATIAHELAHTVHLQKISDDKTKPSLENSFWNNLWLEGVAVAMTSKIAPDASYEEILFDRALAEKCTPSQVSTWAKMFLADSAAGDSTLLKQWFLYNDKPTHLEGIRAGYCLGLHVALAAEADGHSWNDLLTMSRDQSQSLSRFLVNRLARQ